MEKIYLLPNTPKYKANLHCHTTFSDGAFTPEEIKKIYKERGYAVVAYTDHEYIVNHQELTDDSFIAITGYEYSLGEAPHDGFTHWLDLKCCHLNLYAKDPYQDKHVCFDPEHVPHCKHPEKLSYTGPIFKATYDDIQHVIDEANKNGYLVCFNHPYWSVEPHGDYFNLKGLFAMEIYNTGGSDYSGHSFYDYGLLAEYNRTIAPVAADDNHNHVLDPDVDHSDSFGGYTMIYTDDFSYTGILSAMERRDVYGSTGIDFDEVSVTGDVLHIECTPCTSIMVCFGGRRWHGKQAYDGNTVTAADFTIPADATYIRVFCTNRLNGSYATTRPYDVPKTQQA